MEDYPFFIGPDVRSEVELKRWFHANVAETGCSCCASKDVEILFWCPGVFYTYCRQCETVYKDDFNCGIGERIGGKVQWDNLIRIATSE